MADFPHSTWSRCDISSSFDVAVLGEVVCLVCPSAFPETLTRLCSSTSSAGSMLSSKARPSQEQRRPLMGGINKSGKNERSGWN